MTWSTDEILEVNPAQPGQLRSKLERILPWAQANLEILAEIADEIEARPSNHVAAFFQLPYAIIAPGWHRVPTLEQGLHAELICEPCCLTMTDTDEFHLIRRDNSHQTNWPWVTQVVALFPLWGQRARFHDKYLTHISSGRNDNPIIVPQRESWIDNRPISLRDYGHNLARRLRREITPILRCFLPAYSIVALREAAVPPNVYAYYAMTAPGQLVFAGESIPIISAFLSGIKHEEPTTIVEAKRLSDAMRMRYREFGRFEAQLFALERLRAQGETALALVGSMSLLEWLLNGLVRQQGGRRLKLFDAVRHRSGSFLTVEELEFIDRARRARNRAVHESPPSRQSLTTPSFQAGRELDGMSAAMSPQEIRLLIELVFRVFRAVNLTGVRMSE